MRESAGNGVAAAHPETATVARLMDQQNLFTAQVLEHDVKMQKTRLRWHAWVLEAAYQPHYPVNDKVCWMIQPANVLLHRRYRPSKGDKENPLQGSVIEYMENNGLANMLVQVDRELQLNIAINVPLHVARRNQLGLHENVMRDVRAPQRVEHALPRVQVPPPFEGVDAPGLFQHLGRGGIENAD